MSDPLFSLKPSIYRGAAGNPNASLHLISHWQNAIQRFTNRGAHHDWLSCLIFPQLWVAVTLSFLPLSGRSLALKWSTFSDLQLVWRNLLEIRSSRCSKMAPKIVCQTNFQISRFSSWQFGTTKETFLAQLGFLFPLGFPLLHLFCATWLYLWPKNKNLVIMIILKGIT